jgi:hypothetical protein
MLIALSAIIVIAVVGTVIFSCVAEEHFIRKGKC